MDDLNDNFNRFLANYENEMLFRTMHNVLWFINLPMIAKCSDWYTDVIGQTLAQHPGFFRITQEQKK